MIESAPIYKMDHNKRIRVWSYQIEDNRWRVCSGLIDGKITQTGWKVVNKAASQPDILQQTKFDAEAARRKRLEQDYYDDLAKAQSGVPAMFECMLAQDYKKHADKIFLKHNVVWVQPKLDGIRCLFTASGPITRGNKPITSVPHIESALASFFEENPDVILDGELYNHDFREDFQTLGGLIRREAGESLSPEQQGLIEYHVYDAFTEGVNSIARTACLVDWWLKTQYKGVRFVPSVAAYEIGDIDVNHAEFISAGYEGSIIRIPGPYEQKRSKLLLKRKDFDSTEFVIKRVIEGVGNWSGCAKAFELYDPEHDVTFNSGIRGSKAYLADVLREAAKYEDGDATCRFFGRSNDKIPRFPVITDLHPGGRKD